MNPEHPPIRRILYVHYQASPTDGSAIHVARFSEAFGALCVKRGIVFEVRGPVLKSPEWETVKDSVWRRARRYLGRYYLREFKVLLQQWRRSRQEVLMLEGLRPDLVITRYDAETLSIHWACRRLGIPVVTEYNGLDRIELAGTYAEFKQLDWVSRLFSNCHALALSAGGMTVSTPIAEDLRRCNPQEKPLVVNHNGVSLDEFDPQQSGDPLRQLQGIPLRRVVIGYVGSFIVWHDPGRLFASFARLLAAGHDVGLLLVGRRVAEVERLITSLPPDAQQRICWPGMVAHELIPGYLAAMDITVLPNTQRYCSPIKLFEYMAMGRACVAPATQPVREVMGDGVDGLLFDSDDAQAFHGALERLVQDPALRRQLGNSARLRVEREFSWENNAERVMALVDSSMSWWQNHRGIK